MADSLHLCKRHAFLITQSQRWDEECFHEISVCIRKKPWPASKKITTFVCVSSFSSLLCKDVVGAVKSPSLRHRTKDPVCLKHRVTIIWLSYGFAPWCCSSAANQITAAHFIYEYGLFKELHGVTSQHWLYFAAWPEVNLLGCRRSGLCDLRLESIVLREFTVSDYMASALGGLEKYRGNATLHVFIQYWSSHLEL